MARRDYPRLGVVEFGERLLSTGDLDPVYITLTGAGLPAPQLKRWLVAYWCLYSCGAASFISEFEGQAFWDWLLSAARNDNDSSGPGSMPPPVGERWPRGHERRHFRGVAGNNAVCALEEAYGEKPHWMVDYITAGAPQYEAVSGRTCAHYLFGPWIGFKVADMVDRVLGEPVDFSEAAVFMFKDPAKAAHLVWQAHYPGWEPRDRNTVISGVVGYLAEQLAGYTAPPFHDRPVGLQEIETVLCKWKSHQNGHYPAFNDTNEIRANLAQWAPASRTAAALLESMPEGGEAW